MNALILSAGLGTRLRPLTNTVPKPLVQIGGIPIIDFITRRLTAEKVSRFGFNLHHLGEKIEKHMKDEFPELDMTFKYEKELLDSGGSISSFKDFCDDGSRLIVHNGDILTNIDITKLIKVSKASAADATFALVKGTNNNVRADSNGKIMDFRETKHLNYGTLYTFAGIAVYSADFVKNMPSGKFNIIDYMLSCEGANFNSVLFEDAYWCDIGTLDVLERVRGEAMKGKITLLKNNLFQA